MRIDLSSDSPKAQIARLTLRRTIRLEAGFLLAQLARLAHTAYVIHVGVHHDSALVAMLERTFVTFLLVVLSVTDVFTRNRINKLLVRLPGGERVWWE